jgi:hypothetical protein
MAILSNIKDFIFSKDFWPVLLISATLLLVIVQLIAVESSNDRLLTIVIALLSFNSGIITYRVYSE